MKRKRIAPRITQSVTGWSAEHLTKKKPINRAVAASRVKRERSNMKVLRSAGDIPKGPVTREMKKGL